MLIEQKWDDPPLVSIIIPCLNEKDYVSSCLESIIRNDYPHEKMEILVCDGMSDDGTREIIHEYITKFPHIKILDNPQKTIPGALNSGIKSARGEIIVRMDMHAVYADDYIKKCVYRLIEFKADNVGGIIETQPKNNSFQGRAIVQALSSPFGVGNSRFRTGSKEPLEVDTVFGGCFQKKLFERVGLFNENLTSNQDLEFNLRLKSLGGKILLFPDIAAKYYARSTLWAFCKNNFRNAFWAVYSLNYVRYWPFNWRHLVPFFFVSSLFVTTILTLIISKTFVWILLSILFPYFVLNVYFSWAISKKKCGKMFFVLPFIFMVLHFSHGLGAVYAFLKLLVSKQFWKLRFRKEFVVTPGL